MKITQPDGTTYELTREESLQVLTNLAGQVWADTPMGVELRQSVANSFAKRYLKEVAHNASMLAMRKTVETLTRETVQNAVAEYFEAKPTSYGGGFLTKTHRDKIKADVKAEFQDQYTEKFELLKDDLKKAVEIRAEKALLEQMDREIALRINSVVSARVKRAMELISQAANLWDEEIKHQIAQDVEEKGKPNE